MVDGGRLEEARLAGLNLADDPESGRASCEVGDEDLAERLEGDEEVLREKEIQGDADDEAEECTEKRGIGPAARSAGLAGPDIDGESEIDEARRSYPPEKRRVFSAVLVLPACCLPLPPGDVVSFDGSEVLRR